MKRLLLLPALLLATVASTFASEQIREAQSALKDEGFYYGEVTGNSSSELSAAIRRFQIRKGLEITGELDRETLDSLGIKAGTPAVRPIAPKTAQRRPAATPPPAKPPVNLRKDDSIQESDQRFLESNRYQPPAPSRDPSIISPPAPLDDEAVAVPSENFVFFFEGTPYVSAPAEVQEETVRKAQQLLASRGFYREAIDGDPGPATEEALLTFQHRMRLPLTGRLDLRTLSALRLLPRGGFRDADAEPFRLPSGTSSRPLRGIWIQ